MQNKPRLSCNHYAAAICAILCLIAPEHAMAELCNATAGGTVYGQSRYMVRASLGPYWQDESDTWTIVGNASLDNNDGTELVTEDGEGVLIHRPGGHSTDLVAQIVTGDCKLTLEFVVPKDSTSGVFLMGRYGVQIADSWGTEHPKFSDCGGIYRENSNSGQDVFAGRAPDKNMSKQPGEWQTFEIEFRAPRFNENGDKTENARFIKVVHNGQTIHENVELTGPTHAAAFQEEEPLGPLMLQSGDGPIAFRKISLSWQTDHPINYDGRPRTP